MRGGGAAGKGKGGGSGKKKETSDAGVLVGKKKGGNGGGGRVELESEDEVRNRIGQQIVNEWMNAGSYRCTRVPIDAGPFRSPLAKPYTLITITILASITNRWAPS